MVMLDIVIVNWNTGGQLRECIRSLGSAGVRDFSIGRVVVVDNASTDGSARGITGLHQRLEVQYNGSNRGFAAACNQGAAGSGSEYILFLNPDTLLFADSLCAPVSFMEREGNAGVAVVGIQMVDEAGTVDRSCARLPTVARCLARVLGLDRIFPRRVPGYLMREWDHSESRHVDHVTGAFYLVRRSVFEGLGGFDERFFVYLEDVDFSVRVSRRGLSCYYLAEARAFHRGGGASRADRASRLFYSIRSRIVYSFKHFGLAGAVLLTAVSLVVEPVLRSVSALAGGSSTRLNETFGAYKMLWRNLPRVLASAASARRGTG